MKTNTKNAYQLLKINRSLSTSKDPVVRERLLLLKQYYQGNSLRSTAEHHQCSHRKVRYWKVRYEVEGLKGLETRHKSGAPLKLDRERGVELKREILQKSIREGGWSVKRIREYIKERGKVVYSLRHTMRIAQQWGLARIIPRPQYAYAKEHKKTAFLKGKY